jgi:signal transduction histidine kinase
VPDPPAAQASGHTGGEIARDERASPAWHHVALVSTTGTSDILLGPDVTFDVERFDWAGDDRLELSGRWSGVRGLRFVRPVLTVPVAGRRRRLVALLEHKPWVATEGDEWVAAFAWDGHREAVGPAQLAVGPSLVVDLPAPGPQRTPPAGEPSPAELALRRAEAAEARAARETEAAQALLRREREEHERRRRQLEAEVDALREDVAAARAVADELRLELAGARARFVDALAAARADADRLRATHDEAVGEARRLRAAHEDAVGEAERLREAQASQLDELAQERERAAELERRLADVSPDSEAPEAAAPADPAPEPPAVDAAPARGTGAGDGRRTVRILDGPQRVPEVKPLLFQAAPLRRSAALVWGRRAAAIVVLLIALAVLVLVLHSAF